MKTGLLLLSLPLASAGGKLTFGSGEHGSIELRAGGLSFNAAACIDRSNWCYPYGSDSCATADDATLVTKTTLSLGSEIALYSDHTIRFTSGDGGCVGLDKTMPTDAQLVASTSAKLAQLKFNSGGVTQARIHNDNNNKLWVQAANAYEGASEITAWTPLGSWNTANSKNCYATPTKEFGAERNLHDPDISAHKGSLGECQKLCEDTATCNCVSYSGSSQQCWLRENCILAQCKAESDSNWISGTTWSEPAAVVTGSWTANAGKNCFVGTGAERNIEEYTFESSVEQCKERCEATDGCNCVVHDDRGVSSKPCHLRENCLISDCQDQAGWSTYYSGAEITSAPTESPTKAPTEAPASTCTNNCLHSHPCRHDNDCSCVQQVDVHGNFVATGTGTCSAGTTALREDQLYYQTLATNCWDGKGADEIIPLDHINDGHDMTYDACKDLCTTTEKCNCFGFKNYEGGRSTGQCMLRRNCFVDQCDSTHSYGGNDWSINVLGPGVGGISAYHSQHTWCGEHNGMITTKKQCQDAALALGKTFVMQTETDNWHAGCIIHNNGVYFSKLTRHPDNHKDGVNGGYLCHAFETTNQCAEGSGMIATENICKDVAAAAGYEYKSSAGPEWPQGCFVHNGGVYYSNHAGSDTNNDPISGGYLCNPKATA